MIRCCIIEDDEQYCKRIGELVKELADKNSYNLSLSLYGNPLLVDIDNNVFDVLLLDIDLPYKNGIDFANEYIQYYPKTKIIFISSHSELVFDTFKVHPYGFVRKDYLEIELDNILEEVFELVSDFNKTLLITTKEQTYVTYLKDIVYIESYDHNCFIHLKNNDCIKQRMSLDKLLMNLNQQFYRINRSFVINLEEVKKISNGKVLLNNGVECMISKGKVSEFYYIFNQYICRRLI